MDEQCESIRNFSRVFSLPCKPKPSRQNIHHFFALYMVLREDDDSIRQFHECFPDFENEVDYQENIYVPMLLPDDNFAEGSDYDEESSEEDNDLGHEENEDEERENSERNNECMDEHVDHMDGIEEENPSSAQDIGNRSVPVG